MTTDGYADRAFDARALGRRARLVPRRAETARPGALRR